MIKSKIEWTLSKIFAFSVLAVGVGGALYFHEPNVLITSFWCGAGLFGAKQIEKTFTNKSQNNSEAL